MYKLLNSKERHDIHQVIFMVVNSKDYESTEQLMEIVLLKNLLDVYIGCRNWKISNLREQSINRQSGCPVIWKDFSGVCHLFAFSFLPAIEEWSWWQFHATIYSLYQSICNWFSNVISINLNNISPTNIFHYYDLSNQNKTIQD